MGRVSQGVIGIRLDEDDAVIGMESIIAGSKQHYLQLQKMDLEKEQN